VCGLEYVIVQTAMENIDESGEHTLFVGDLSREVTREDLCDLFGMVGEVSKVVLKCSKVTGQPMGYGFVRMATKQGAENALTALAGMNLKGRCIRVGRAERNCRVIVKNLDQNVRLADLLALFLPYGNMHHHDTGQEVFVNGYSARILHFIRRQDAERAKRDMHLKVFHGRPMHVEWYRHTPGSELSGVGESDSIHRPEPVVSIHVRFMSMEEGVKVDEHLLYHTFKKFGEVTKVSIKAMVPDKDSHVCKGYAFVHFPSTLDGCRCALEAAGSMDGSMYNCVHFFCKPSQNFQRAHKELLKHSHYDRGSQRHMLSATSTASHPYRQSRTPHSQLTRHPYMHDHLPSETQMFASCSGDSHRGMSEYYPPARSSPPAPDYQSVEDIQHRGGHAGGPDECIQSDRSTLGYEEMLYMEAVGRSTSGYYEHNTVPSEESLGKYREPSAAFAPDGGYFSEHVHRAQRLSSYQEEIHMSSKDSSGELQRNISAGGRFVRNPPSYVSTNSGRGSYNSNALLSPTSHPLMHRLSPRAVSYAYRRDDFDFESGNRPFLSTDSYRLSESVSLNFASM